MTLSLTIPGFAIQNVAQLNNQLEVNAKSINPSAVCPRCRIPSFRVHSYYIRSPQDLPISDLSARLKMTVRRFRCFNHQCPQKTFVERLPDFLPMHAQRTLRLTTALQSLGLALGGEAGSRLSTYLYMPTSPDTLLRLIRGLSAIEENPPRVVGVDDFAMQKGRVYGTLLVDLERRQPIDLLPDRTADSLAQWLRSHPGIEIITRDRSTEYARGATEGAPDAVQIVDRWHLLQNLREALERLLNRLHSRLNQLSRTPEVSARLNQPKRKLSRQEQRKQQAKRDRRYRQYQEVKDLYEQGLPILQIAKQLGISRTTVRTFACSPQFPERARKKDVPGLLTPYLSYLHRRFEEGCENSSQLWREIQSQGFSGSRKQVARWILQRRGAPAKTTPTKYIHQEGEKAEKETSLAAPRQLVWLLLKDETELEKDEQIILQYLRQDPDVNMAYQLGQEFQRMIQERKPEALDNWLAAGTKSGMIDLQNFAAGLRRDLPAVRAALREPWSNGQTEGQITRLKLLKRQMYGRAKLDLLRQRVLFSG